MDGFEETMEKMTATERGVSSPRRRRCRPAVRPKRIIRDRVVDDIRERGRAGNRRGEIAGGRLHDVSLRMKSPVLLFPSEGAGEIFR
jgi:hypothetical protein